MPVMHPKKIATQLTKAWQGAQGHENAGRNWHLVERLAGLVLPASDVLITPHRQQKQLMGRQQKIRVIQYLKNNPRLASQVMGHVQNPQLKLVIRNLLKQQSTAKPSTRTTRLKFAKPTARPQQRLARTG